MSECELERIRDRFTRRFCEVASLRDLRREMALQKYLLIAVGGALGSIARYWVGSTISGRMGTRFPYGTLSST